MYLLPALLMVFGLPLIGVTIAGETVERYLEFPPVTDFVRHAPFSWTAFTLIVLFVLTTTLPIVIRLIRTRVPSIEKEAAPRKFPWWGWVAITWLAVWWVLAWTRFDWFRFLQPHTFTPLWLGYIALVNALACARSGRSLLTHRTRYLLALFPLSAVFWWSFEYLNRFVQNWHYVGTEQFSMAGYILHATISFSTVLPGVISTTDLLTTFPRLRARASRLWPIRTHRPKFIAGMILIGACMVMYLIGRFPNYLFPFVWMGPVFLIVSVQTLIGRRTILSTVAHGNWAPIVLPALAALVCGFFWELWNVNSLAHWEYTVPFINRFQIFEMPLLGYAGYLPFGLECMVVAGLIARDGIHPHLSTATH